MSHLCLLISIRPELLPLLPFPLDVPSLLTDFYQVVEIPWPEEKADAYIFIQEAPEMSPQWTRENNNWLFQGPFLRLSREASDRRFSFWGNLGFLYRLTLALLEKNHDIYSLHACGLIDETNHRLIVVAGGAGSGKTVFLLRGLEKGLKLFSTETVHFRLEGQQIKWFMGSLVDNIRLGTLRHDFPSFWPADYPGQIKFEREWQTKVAVDLSGYKYGSSTLTSPACLLLFPRVEEGRPGFLVNQVEDKRQAARIIFSNMTEKIANSFVLYDFLAVTGLDTPSMAARRLEVVTRLLSHPTIKGPIEILTNPRECWGEFLE